jgi:hypothetical protein
MLRTHRISAGQDNREDEISIGVGGFALNGACVFGYQLDGCSGDRAAAGIADGAGDRSVYTLSRGNPRQKHQNTSRNVAQDESPFSVN